MKYTNILLITIFVLSLISISVFASEFNAVVRYDAQVVNIYGSLGSNVRGTATLIVLKPGSDLNNFESLNYEERKSLINHFEVGVLQNGCFAFTYEISGESGNYPVRLYYKDGSEFLDTTLTYLNKSDADDIKNMINETTSSSELANVIATKIPNQLAELLYTRDLSPIQKSFVWEKVYDNKNYKEFTDVIDTINRYSVIELIYSAQTDMKAIELLSVYSKLLKIFDAAEYALYENADNTFKSAVIKKTRSNKEDFEIAFCEGVLLEGIKKAGNYGIVNSLIKSFAAKLDLDISSYFKLADTKKIDTQLLGEEFNSKVELEKQINKLITESSDKDKEHRSNNSGSGRVINATFTEDSILQTEETPIEIIYSDVPAMHWGYESIRILTNKGCISGDGYGNFRPEDYITREEFLKIVLETFELVDKTAVSTFSDVETHDWSYSYVATAQSFEIIFGQDNFFKPKSNITREEAAVILLRTITFKNYILLDTRENIDFNDKNDISAYAVDCIDKLYMSGVLNGIGDKEIAPKANTTRAQAAHMIYSMLSKVR